MRETVLLLALCGIALYLIGDWYLDRMGKEIRSDFDREFPDMCCYCSFIEWGIHSGKEEPDARPKAEFVDESCREVTGDLDGPPCHVCGAIMVPGRKDFQTFWRCLSCGTETRPS